MRGASHDPIADLIDLEVRWAHAIREDWPRMQADAASGKTEYANFGNYNYMQAAYLLAHVYRLEHPANSLKRAAWCAEIAIAMTDLLCEDWRKRQTPSERTTTAEWNIFSTIELFDWFGQRIEGARRELWQAFVDTYLAYALEKPYGFTSPNHDAWRALLLYRAGTVFGRPELHDRARFFVRQQLALQTPEGFWEEGRHHGPSMRYNQVMLVPLAWLYRLTGDRALGDAAGRLARFMSTYTFPDGTTVGAFDGRQSTSLAFYSPACPGLELVPEGRTLGARCLQLHKDAGCFKDVRRFSASAWYAYFGQFFHAASCRYFAEILPEKERAGALAECEPLRVDATGALENHSLTFDGLLQRQGPWTVALSSQHSDIPRGGVSIFRLERESRLEIWHAKHRLLIGGGHNRLDWPVPYATAVLDTGFAGETQFGRMDQKQNAKRRGYYMPRWHESRVNGGVPELKLLFGHGTVTWRVRAEGESALSLEAEWDTQEVRRLCLQLPVVVWRGATLSLGGKPLESRDYALHELKGELRATGGPWNTDLKLTPPAGVPCRVHVPLTILRDYAQETLLPDLFTPAFHLALVSCQWTDPTPKGKALFKVTL